MKTQFLSRFCPFAIQKWMHSTNSKHLPLRFFVNEIRSQNGFMQMNFTLQTFRTFCYSRVLVWLSSGINIELFVWLLAPTHNSCDCVSLAFYLFFNNSLLKCMGKKGESKSKYERKKIDDRHKRMAHVWRFV